MTSIRKLKKQIRRENWIRDDYILMKEQTERWLRGESRYNCAAQLRCHHVRRYLLMRARKGRKQKWNK